VRVLQQIRAALPREAVRVLRLIAVLGLVRHDDPKLAARRARDR